MKSTNNKHGDILNTQMSVENTHKGTSLIEHIEVPGTPFFVSGNDETGYILRLGNYKLTQPELTIQNAKDLLIVDQWNIIANMMFAIINIERIEKDLQESNK